MIIIKSILLHGVNSMNLLTSTVKQEKERIEYMINKYKMLKKQLPKGTLCPKKMGNQTYYYLKYRDGDRIVSDYVHKDNLPWLEEQLDHRKHIDIMIKALKEELNQANKLLRDSRRKQKSGSNK